MGVGGGGNGVEGGRGDGGVGGVGGGHLEGFPKRFHEKVQQRKVKCCQLKKI